eukprot:1386502-Rhodomonas_salina.1
MRWTRCKKEVRAQAHAQAYKVPLGKPADAAYFKARTCHVGAPAILSVERSADEIVSSGGEWCKCSHCTLPVGILVHLEGSTQAHSFVCSSRDYAATVHRETAWNDAALSDRGGRRTCSRCVQRAHEGAWSGVSNSAAQEG